MEYTKISSAKEVKQMQWFLQTWYARNMRQSQEYGKAHTDSWWHGNPVTIAKGNTIKIILIS